MRGELGKVSLARKDCRCALFRHSVSLQSNDYNSKVTSGAKQLNSKVTTVSLAKGMAVLPSRYAVLSVGNDSESEEENNVWQVAQLKSKGATKKPVVTPTPDEGKAMSRNAKKRARKKRNKSSSCDQTGPVSPLEDEKDKYDRTWKKKNKEATEEDYQKDLREALLLSAMDAKETCAAQISKEESVPDIKALDSKSSKRNVKISLQELHNPSAQDTTVKHDRNLQVQSVQDEDLVTSLLEDVETEILKTLQRDKVLQTKGASSLSEEDQSMIPRLAQLEDKLEKRDKIILKLKKENVALKEALKEVRERNQSLCTIMSQGEFSEKADLVKQVNDLSVLKDDLTLEIESLNAALEQEKSKNKVLTKYQTSQSKITKQSIH